MQSKCQTVWTLMIWAQTVCQGYQQTTLVDKELKLVLMNETLKHF